MSDKNHIGEINTGIERFDTHFNIYHELMSQKVLDVLLVASPYDAFVMEEDGSLASKITTEYRGLNLSRPPRLTRVDCAEDALAALDRKRFDLVIAMPYLEGMDALALGRAAKKRHPDLPVILLAHSMSGIRTPSDDADAGGIDRVFVWNGDGNLLLAIVKNTEDHLNARQDTQLAEVRVLILVEDSPVYRSLFLPMLYKEVVRQTQAVLEESLNQEHRLLKMRARPKILIADDFEHALTLFQRYRPYVFGIISDTRFPMGGMERADAGFYLLSAVRREVPHLPLLLISAESANRSKAARMPVLFLDKNSPDLPGDIHQFFIHHLGFGAFVFRHPDGSEIGRAEDLRSLEELLPKIPDEPLYYEASRNRFTNWFMARSEIALASRLRDLTPADFADTAAMRNYLIECIRSLRRQRQRGVVVQYNPNRLDPAIVEFAKIGSGSLGGKALGLAFVSSLLTRSGGEMIRYPGLQVVVPRTLVVASDIFDAVVADNRLDQLDGDLPDAQIASRFSRVDLPSELEKDLTTFLDRVHCPLSVRSSSRFEDAYHNPYSGLYRTCTIPNDHPDPAVRLHQLTAAIKLVWASVFFLGPRRFAHSTIRRFQQDSMAVMIQHVAGRRQGRFFYPAISGVACSYNYYPVGRLKPEEGVARIVMGMGRLMSEDRRSGLRFCPAHPRYLPQFSTVEDILDNAQRHFYALPLDHQERVPTVDDDGLMIRREIYAAADESPMAALASTYVPEEHRIRDTSTAAGTKVLTFAPVLKYETVPLAPLLHDVLEMGRRGIGQPVEMEFALDLSPAGHDGDTTFHILQMRPMAAGETDLDLHISPGEVRRAVCFSTRALGNGRRIDIADVVYVKPAAFDPAQTVEIARHIGAFNADLAAAKRPYALIGFGRWGSADRWLGIPVGWDDISQVGAMVEVRDGKINADPSEGSHFFHAITSLGIHYLTVNPGGEDRIRWRLLEDRPARQETEYVRHVRFDRPLVLKGDGLRGRAVLFTQ